MKSKVDWKRVLKVAKNNDNDFMENWEALEIAEKISRKYSNPTDSNILFEIVKFYERGW